MFNDLSIQEKAAVIKLGVGSGLRSLLLIEDFYNSAITGGGGRPMAVRTMDRSDADFARRMRDPKRMTIRDWMNGSDIATHKMSWAEDDVSPYIFPVVQRHGNYLKDYSDPRYSYNNAALIALLNGDYMRTLNPLEAEWLTTNYKDYYPGFEEPLINASIGREYSMPDYRAVAMTSSPMYGIEWNPDDDELDYRDIRNRQLYLESAGKETSRSGKGAQGIFQIMPGTALWYQDSTGDVGDIWDPIYNERVRDWAMDRNWESNVVKEGNPSNKTRMKKTLAAYNYGVGNLQKALNRAKKAGVDTINGDAWLDYLPSETRNYVNFIMNGLDASEHKTLDKYQEWLGSGNKHIKAYGGPKDAVRKAIYNRMPIVGNYILPEVVVTPEQEEPSWFARLSINAAMADNAPYMQAVGWLQDNNGNYHQDPTTSGSEELRKALFEIGINGAMDIFGAPVIERAVESGIQGIKGLKNVYKSQKYFRDLDRLYSKAFNEIPVTADGGFTKEGYDMLTKLDRNMANKLHGENADITGLSYFKTKNPDLFILKGRFVRTVGDNTGKYGYISKYDSRAEAAAQVAEDTLFLSLQKPVTTSDILRMAREDFERIKPGHTAALVENNTLSKDSYPLLERLSQREALRGTGKITPVIDDGTYRMIKLNEFGRYLRKSDIDKAIQGLREITNDPNIPNRVSLFGNHFVPAFTFTKFDDGGYITPTLTSDNIYKKGGSIHIKQENRGKFTALKKRTGHSASWFKAHGTPALRKMATFALNARKWHHKHPDGGSLFDRWHQYMQNNTIDVPMTFNLPEVQVTAQAPRPGDTNYDKYIANTYDAWKRGDVDINTLPTETRNRVRGYSGIIAALKGMNTAAKVAGITAAIPTGIIGGISFAPTAWSIMNNPIVDAGLTIHGAINAPKNIREGVQELQEGNYGRGALDLGLTALDLYGAGNLAFRLGRIANPAYRAKHAYNAIQPAGYEDATQRAKDWFKSMWNNPNIDYKNPLWYQKLKDNFPKGQYNYIDNDYLLINGFTGTGDKITSNMALEKVLTNTGDIADKARMDAWAIYNGLPQLFGTYIKNIDGTYSYDLNRIDLLTNGHLHIPIGDEISHVREDFITGAGGNLEKWYRKSGDKYSGEGVTVIEDMWDLQPFKFQDWDVSRRLSDKLVEKHLIPKKIIHLYDKKHPYDIKYDGSPDYNFFPKLGEKTKNFEVGKLTGGKPFLMKTEIPWYIDNNNVARLNLGNHYNIRKQPSELIYEKIIHHLN